MTDDAKAVSKITEQEYVVPRWSLRYAAVSELRPVFLVVRITE